MFIEISLEEAQRLIKYTHIILKKVVIPRDVGYISHSLYKPEYDWLFYIERKIAKALKPWLYKYRYELIGANGIISEAFSNAYVHGNRRDIAKKITCVIYKGDNGIIVQLLDEGGGFDYRGTIKLLKNEGNYFHLAGNGLKKMINSLEFSIFYSENGRSFHLLYLFNSSF